MRLGAAIPVLNEWRFLPAVVGQLLLVVDRCVLLRGERSLSGAPVRLTAVPQIDPRVEIVTGRWWTESQTRNAGLDFLADCEYVIGIDTDEVVLEEDLLALRRICDEERPDVVAMRLSTHWKTPDWRIDPPEDGTVPLAVRRGFRYEGLRAVPRAKARVAGGTCRHLSYVRTDEELREKLATWGHAAELGPGWYDRVWKAWDSDHGLRNLHPVHPEAYARAVEEPDPELRRTLSRWGCA